MDESQAGDTGNSGIADGDHASSSPVMAGLSTRRVKWSDFEEERRRLGATFLGGVAYGAEPRGSADGRLPWVCMPVVDGEDFCELWSSDAPAVAADADGIHGACNGDVLFGALQATEPQGLEAATEDAYSRLFDYVDRLDYPYLWRVWHYFPGINKRSSRTERYRQFNTGRRTAFEAKGRVVAQDAPAASALGSASGPLTIFFLASKRPGIAVENPRQVSAYRYPPRYGPRSPTFSRGMCVTASNGRILFISGTASIVGHETRHAGDIQAQTSETINNLRAVLAEGIGDVADAGKLWMKVYVRHRDDVPHVRTALERDFPGADMVYVEADVCRSNLLVEVEAVHFSDAA